jgi:hypothetical protein
LFNKKKKYFQLLIFRGGWGVGGWGGWGGGGGGKSIFIVPKSKKVKKREGEGEREKIERCMQYRVKTH